jgi:hypothetical protein
LRRLALNHNQRSANQQPHLNLHLRLSKLNLHLQLAAPHSAKLHLANPKLNHNLSLDNHRH